MGSEDQVCGKNLLTLQVTTKMEAKRLSETMENFYKYKSWRHIKLRTFLALPWEDQTWQNTSEF
jgi:hypothetical protein